jgi:hypothetical protein
MDIGGVDEAEGHEGELVGGAQGVKKCLTMSCQRGGVDRKRRVPQTSKMRQHDSVGAGLPHCCHKDERVLNGTRGGLPSLRKQADLGTPKMEFLP